VKSERAFGVLGIILQISRSARFKLHKKCTLSAGHKPYLAIWFGKNTR